MNFEIVSYNTELVTDWNNFLQGCKNGLFQFDRKYMEYHRERFEDASLVIYKGNKIVALFPANKRDYSIYSHEGLTYGGMLFSKDMKAVEAIEILSLIKKHYTSLGFKEFIYKSIPYIFHELPSQEDLYALFRNDFSIYRTDIFSVIKISEAIRFSETKRQAVRKCIKNEVEIIENPDFADYWKLLTSVLKSHNANPVHSLSEILFLKSHFSGNIKLFEARLKGELLAGVLIYDFGRVVHTQYMANSKEGRKVGALDFINHYLINEMYKNRDYYSFGASNENQGKLLNEGLIQQKELMGGRGVAHHFYKSFLQ